MAPRSFNHLTTRATGGVILRGLHRTRHSHIVGGCSGVLGRLIRNRISHRSGHFVCVSLNSNIRTNLDGHRAVPGRRCHVRSHIRICVCGMTSTGPVRRPSNARGHRCHNPLILIDHASPNVLGHLFRGRIPRLGRRGNPVR